MFSVKWWQVCASLKVIFNLDEWILSAWIDAQHSGVTLVTLEGVLDYQISADVSRYLILVLLLRIRLGRVSASSHLRYGESHGDDMASFFCITGPFWGQSTSWHTLKPELKKNAEHFKCILGRNMFSILDWISRPINLFALYCIVLWQRVTRMIKQKKSNLRLHFIHAMWTHYAVGVQNLYHSKTSATRIIWQGPVTFIQLIFARVMIKIAANKYNFTRTHLN